MAQLRKPIPVVALGVYRSVALRLETAFAARPYRLAAVMSLRDLPEHSQYTPHNLSVVLHSMQPPPQVLITGAAISADMTRQSIEVFERYVSISDVGRTLVVNVGVDRLTVTSRSDVEWLTLRTAVR